MQKRASRLFSLTPHRADPALALKTPDRRITQFMVSKEDIFRLALDRASNPLSMARPATRVLRINKSGVPCKRAIRSSESLWVVIRPKYGIAWVGCQQNSMSSPIYPGRYSVSACSEQDFRRFSVGVCRRHTDLFFLCSLRLKAIPRGAAARSVLKSPFVQEIGPYLFIAP